MRQLPTDQRWVCLVLADFQNIHLNNPLKNEKEPLFFFKHISAQYNILFFIYMGFSDPPCCFGGGEKLLQCIVAEI